MDGMDDHLEIINQAQSLHNNLPEEKPIAFLLAEDKFLKIKQAIEEEQNQPDDIQELMLKLLNDLKIYDEILLKQEEQAVQEEQEEQTAQSFLLNWNFPMVDDDEYTILYRSTKTITPDLPTVDPDNSLTGVAMINNFDELNEDECFDLGGGEINVSQNIKDDDSFAFVIRTFLPYLTYPGDSPLLLSTGSEDTIFDPGIST
ncbi:hypothetical protein Tco_1494173 [Tanacetum coccineum]